MAQIPFLNDIDNKTIQFVSHRPSGSAFAILDRKISVVGPEIVVSLVKEPDVSLLPALIELLKDPAKAWAAAIILTSLTGDDGKIIESFSGEPEKWWKTIGVNVHEHWDNWYHENKNSIQWDKAKNIFTTAV